MVKALLALLRLLRTAPVFEFVGAALVVWGVYEQWGIAPAAIVAGAAVLLKSLDIDMRSTAPGDSK